MRFCNIEGCNEKHEAKGYCKKHYRAFNKYGDPLYQKKKVSSREYPTDRKPKVPYESNHKSINNVEHKLCLYCANWLPMNSENFYKNKSNKSDGYHTYCKNCCKDKSYNYYIENKEHHLKQKYTKYRIDDEFRNRKLRKQRERDRANREFKSTYLKEWQKVNKDKVKKYNLERNMNKKHDITKEEWLMCLEYFDFKCAYCGITEQEAMDIYSNRLHKDHLAHDGANDLTNCIPACKGCNCSKHTMSLNEWYNEENHPNFTYVRFSNINNWISLFKENVSVSK